MFRLTILAAALLAIAAPASANDDQQYCTDIEDMARTIMEARQRNASMSRVMQIVAETLPSAKDLMQMIVMQAYEKPAYSTPEYRQREIDEFANYWSAQCYEARKKKR